MKIVMKFGGTSLGSGDLIHSVAQIIASYSQDNELLVVVSAMAGVTDSLISIGNKVMHNSDEKIIPRFINKLRNKHFTAWQNALYDKSKEEVVKKTINNLLHEVEVLLRAIQSLGELSGRSEDRIISYGEKLVIPILHAALQKKGIKSISFFGEDLIVTDDNFGDARYLEKETVQCLGKTKILQKNAVAIVTGFAGRTRDGKITTMGRGASDYSAAILGGCLNMDEILIWTDVDGVMTADPHLVEIAQSIKTLSYAEIKEMAYFGAKVLHPWALEPAAKRNIPIRVKNTFNPQHEGSLIISDIKKVYGSVKSIATIHDVVVITARASRLDQTLDTSEKIFQLINQHHVPLISQTSSMQSITLILRRKPAAKLWGLLRQRMENQDTKFNILKHVGLITLVGAGMQQTVGLGARLFGALSSAKVNVSGVSHGSSEMNISLVVREEHVKKALQALHKEFQMDQRGR
jgi:aspartate kinase